MSMESTSSGTGGDDTRRHVYTPHLKKVLRSYQAAATTSLHGPNSVMGVWPDKRSPTPDEEDAAGPAARPAASASAPAVTSPEYDPPPPFPIQQPPLFAPADPGCDEQGETLLGRERISCFSVGGEERLCLPQILNSALRDFSLAQINSVCDALHIFCSRCSSEQLRALKATGVLPLSAPSCGLITKTDAERLCAALLREPPAPPREPPPPGCLRVRVYHECFGKCKGTYSPELYTEEEARCIECAECKGMLSPRRFVCHAHPPRENRTCHWGFDSQRWRSYVLLEDEEDQRQREALADMKSRFDLGHKYKRKQDVITNCSTWSNCQNRILAESCDSSNKRVRVDSWYPYTYSFDPTLVYWYANPLWSKATAAFKPLSPVITKDGKPLYTIPPEALPFFKDRLDTHYQHSLALTPANVQKLGLVKMPEETVIAYHAEKTESTNKKLSTKKDADYESNPCCFDSEDAFSDTSFSTLSAGTEDCLMSNFDEDDEVQPNTENELLEINKILTDVDSSLRTKILSEVESITAKYRKCLNSAIQGKKLYQMELEKLHYAQRAKIRKLKEANKDLQKTVQKLQDCTASADASHEQSQPRSEPRATPDLSSPQSRLDAAKDEAADVDTTLKSLPSVEEGDDGRGVSTTREAGKVPSPSSSPKLSPLPESEPLGK